MHVETWRAGRRLSTPLALHPVAAPVSPACSGLLTGTGPVVWPWLKRGGVPLVRPLLRLASDVLWDRCGAEPREAKTSKHDLHIHRIPCRNLGIPKFRDPPGIKQSNQYQYQ